MTLILDSNVLYKVDTVGAALCSWFFEVWHAYFLPSSDIAIVMFYVTQFKDEGRLVVILIERRARNIVFIHYIYNISIVRSYIFDLKII